LHDTIKEKNEELKEQNLDIAKLNDMNAKVRKLKTENKVLNERTYQETKRTDISKETRLC
jgi:predicted nuclease with TOPRIM domain